MNLIQKIHLTIEQKKKKKICNVFSSIQFYLLNVNDSKQFFSKNRAGKSFIKIIPKLNSEFQI